MTFADYCRIDAVNWSLLKEMGRSPAHYLYRREHPREDTAAMRLGRAVHCAVLEPRQFARTFVVYDGVRRGKAWEEFAAAHAADDVLSVTDYEQCQAIRDAVRANRDARRLLRKGISEKTLTWTDRATRIPCKARVDRVGHGFFVELKTARSLDPHDFRRTCAQLAYHGQLAFYLRGLKANRRKSRPYLIAVESAPPYDVIVYEPDEDFIWMGDELATELLARLKSCQRTRRWPGRATGVQTLSLPGWLFDQYDAETSDLVFTKE